MRVRVTFEIETNEDPTAILEATQEAVAQAFGYDEEADESVCVEEV